MFDVILGKAFPQKLFLKDTWCEKDNVIKPRLHKQWLSNSWIKLRQVQHFPSKTLLVIVILFHNYTSSIFFFQWRWWPDVLTVLCIFCFTKQDAGCWWHVFWNCCSFFLRRTRNCSPGLLLPSWRPGLCFPPLTGIQRLTSFLVCWVKALLTGRFFPVSHLTLCYSH